MTMKLKVLDISVRWGVDSENDHFSHGQNLSKLFIYILYKLYIYYLYVYAPENKTFNVLRLWVN